MVVHVRVHALVSLAASAAWPDKKREPNRRQTTHRQVSFIDIFYNIINQVSGECWPDDLFPDIEKFCPNSGALSTKQLVIVLD